MFSTDLKTCVAFFSHFQQFLLFFLSFMTKPASASCFLNFRHAHIQMDAYNVYMCAYTHLPSLSFKVVFKLWLYQLWLSPISTKTFSKILCFPLSPETHTMTFQIQKEKKCNVGLRNRKTKINRKNQKLSVLSFYALQSLMIDVAISFIICSCHSPLNHYLLHRGSLPQTSFLPVKVLETLRYSVPIYAFPLFMARES